MGVPVWSRSGQGDSGSGMNETTVWLFSLGRQGTECGVVLRDKEPAHSKIYDMSCSYTARAGRCRWEEMQIGRIMEVTSS